MVINVMSVLTNWRKVLTISIGEHPDFCVITSDDEHGYGVYAWTRTEKEARDLAKQVSGRWSPVDYFNGELIIPGLAVKMINERFCEIAAFSEKESTIVFIIGEKRYKYQLPSPYFLTNALYISSESTFKALNYVKKHGHLTT
jgi:hypothetical protein